jgi:hypothetical protein
MKRKIEQEFEKVKKKKIETPFETTLVNVKVANLRPKYQNLKEFCENDSNLYIGENCKVKIDRKGRCCIYK